MINAIFSVQESVLRHSSKWLGVLALLLICATSNASAQSTWNNFTNTGNDWNTSGNWSAGVPGVGVTANVGATDPGSAFTVTYNTPMSAASFGALNLSWDGSLTSGGSTTDTVTLNINASGFNSTGTDFVNGLGTINVNSGGVYTASGALNLGTYNSFYNGTVNVLSGGSLNVGGTTTISAGSLNIASSSTLASVVLTSSNVNDTFTISGGTNSVGLINDIRDNSAKSATTGVIVTGGNTTASGVTLGTGPSWGNMSVSGGTFTVSSSGNFIVGNTTGNNGRAGSLIVSGTGTLNDSNTTNGLILGNTGSTASGTSSYANALAFTGGTSNLGKITLLSTNVGAGYASATMTLSGTAIVYLGTGGLVTNATGTNSTEVVNLNGGTLAASGNWSSLVPLTLDSTGTAAVTLQAADSSAVAHNINLSGVLSGGAGGIIKTGAGTLTLSGSNTYTGVTAINAGTLQVANTPGAGTSATGSGNVTLGAATLTGSGSVTGTVTASNGTSSVITPGLTTATGALALGGITSTSGLTLNMAVDGAGATNSSLTLGSGGFSASGTNLTLNLYDLGTNTLAAGTIYNLATGLGTWTAPATITATLLNSGYTLNTTYGSYGNGINYNAGTNVLSFEVVAVPEPSTWALLIGGLAFLIVIQRRKAKRA